MGKKMIHGNRSTLKPSSESNEDRTCRSPPSEIKEKRLWTKKVVKYELVDYNSLPSHMKDNEYILRHYRTEWPLKQIFLSVFTIHNETFNVWTHLIGFFLFLSLTIYTVSKVPNVVDLPRLQNFQKLHTQLITCLPSLLHMPDLHRFREGLITSLPSMDMHIKELATNCLAESLSHINHTDTCVLRSVKEDVANIVGPVMGRPISRWPMLAFLGGAMFCLLASSACHLLYCHSQRLSYILLRLDYAGISALISTSFYPPVYYSFVCQPRLCTLYMGSITLLGVGAMVGSLHPVFQIPKYRKFRASLFFGMGVSGAVPILHKLFVFGQYQQEAVQTTVYEAVMGVLYGVGALVYAMRIPERWLPGRFDIVGHSHQIFHVLVVAGAYVHYRAGLLYLTWRDTVAC